MATLGVTVGYRPVRIGWCVRPGNLDDLRAALRLTHTLWGGRFNPIIPVGLPFDRILVKAFAVDVLLPATQITELVDFSKSFGELYWPDAMSLVFPDGSRSTSPIFVDVRRPIETIRQEREKSEPSCDRPTCSRRRCRIRSTMSCLPCLVATHHRKRWALTTPEFLGTHYGQRVWGPQSWARESPRL